MRIKNSQLINKLSKLMNITVIYSLISLFSVASFAANEGAFYCHSEMMKPYMSYGKAYVQSVSCEDIKGGFFTSAKELAEAECAKWSKGLGIDKFTTKYFDAELNGSDFYEVCRVENRTTFSDLDNAKIQVVKAFDTTSESAGGSIAVPSHLYVDNHDSQKSYS